MKTKVFLLTILIIGLTSCATYRPIAKSVSDPDYNNRIQVTQPEYYVSPNAIGITVGAAMPVAGAVAGAMLGPVQQQTAAGRSSSKVGSAVFGALVGAGVSYGIDALAGYRTKADVDNIDKWAERAGGDYIVISSEKVNSRYSTVRLIDRNVENHFVVKRLADVRDFVTAFPNSVYSDDVMLAGIKNLSRDDMPALVQLMPKSKFVVDATDRYIAESPSFDALSKALAKYSTSKDVEPLYVSLVKTADEAIRFNGLYPNSKYKRKVVANAFRTSSNTLESIKKLKSVYGQEYDLDSKDLKYAADDVKRNYYLAQINLLPTRAKNTIADINKKYEWLIYKGKDQDILDQWWPLCMSGATKGSKVISDMGQLTSSTYATKAGIDGKRIKEFTQTKISEIVKEKVKPISTNTSMTGSEEFQQWLKAAYTAGMVQESDHFKVLIYGEIKNNSIFDIPVEVNMSGVLYKKQHIEATGILGGILGSAKAILEGLGGSVTVDERLNNRKILVSAINTGSGFAIPMLEAGKTAPYAILLEISEINGESTNRKGVNFADIIKGTEELMLEDVKVLTALDTRKEISKQQLKTQAEWLALAKNGLPSAGVYDVFRGEKLRQSKWDKEWSEIVASAAAASSSYSSSSSEKVSGIDYAKIQRPTEKERITLAGYDLGLADENEDYILTGGKVYLKNGNWYSWRIVYRHGEPFTYDFDPGAFSFWSEHWSYEEMLNAIVEYDANK